MGERNENICGSLSGIEINIPLYFIPLNPQHGPGMEELPSPSYRQIY